MPYSFPPHPIPYTASYFVYRQSGCWCPPVARQANSVGRFMIQKCWVPTIECFLPSSAMRRCASVKIPLSFRNSVNPAAKLCLRCHLNRWWLLICQKEALNGIIAGLNVNRKHSFRFAQILLPFRLSFYRSISITVNSFHKSVTARLEALILPKKIKQQ